MSAFYACFGYTTDKSHDHQDLSKRVPYVLVFDVDQGYNDPEKTNPAVTDAVAAPYKTEAEAWDAAITHAKNHGWKAQKPETPQWFEVIGLLKDAGLGFVVTHDTWGGEVSYPCVHFRFEDDHSARTAYELLTAAYPEYHHGDPDRDLIVAYGERYDMQDEMWLSLELLDPPLPLEDDARALKKTRETLDILNNLLEEADSGITQVACGIINHLMANMKIDRALEMANEVHEAYFEHGNHLEGYVFNYERSEREGKS